MDISALLPELTIMHIRAYCQEGQREKNRTGRVASARPIIGADFTRSRRSGGWVVFTVDATGHRGIRALDMCHPVLAVSLTPATRATLTLVVALPTGAFMAIRVAVAVRIVPTVVMTA